MHSLNGNQGFWFDGGTTYYKVFSVVKTLPNWAQGQSKEGKKTWVGKSLVWIPELTNDFLSCNFCLSTYTCTIILLSIFYFNHVRDVNFNICSQISNKAFQNFSKVWPQTEERSCHKLFKLQPKLQLTNFCSFRKSDFSKSVWNGASSLGTVRDLCYKRSWTDTTESTECRIQLRCKVFDVCVRYCMLSTDTDTSKT